MAIGVEAVSEAEPRPGSAAAWRGLGPPALVFAVALAVRLLYLAQARGDPLFHAAPLVGDPLYYHAFAQSVARGDWLAPTPYFLAPLYCYGMGLLYAAFGPEVAVVKVAQALLGALSCALLWDIGRRVFSAPVAWIASLGLACYGLHVFYSGVILPTVLVVFLNLLFLWTLVAGSAPPSVPRSLAAGVALGLACAAKANALLLLPAAALGLWLAGGARAPRRWAASLLALGAATAALIAPFSLHNYAASGKFVLLTTAGGRNLLKGSGPHADGSHTFLPIGYEGTGLAYHLMPGADGSRAVDDSREMARRAWTYMLAHPGRTLRLWVKKLALFFNARELFVRDNYYFAQRSSWLLRLPLPGFALVAPLGLVGMLWAWQRRPQSALVYAILAAQLASFIPLFVLARYRMVAVCCLLLFGAELLVWTGRSLRARRGRALAGTLALLVPAALLVHLPFPEFPRERGYAEQWLRLADHHWAAGARERAALLYRRALKSTWARADPSLPGAKARERIRTWEQESAGAGPTREGRGPP